METGEAVGTGDPGLARAHCQAEASPCSRGQRGPIPGSRLGFQKGLTSMHLILLRCRRYSACPFPGLFGVTLKFLDWELQLNKSQGTVPHPSHPTVKTDWKLAVQGPPGSPVSFLGQARF